MSRSTPRTPRRSQPRPRTDEEGSRNESRDHTHSRGVEPSYIRTEKRETEKDAGAKPDAVKVHVNALFQSPPPTSDPSELAAFYKRQAEELASQLASSRRADPGVGEGEGAGSGGGPSGGCVGEEVRGPSPSRSPNSKDQGRPAASARVSEISFSVSSAGGNSKSNAEARGSPAAASDHRRASGASSKPVPGKEEDPRRVPTVFGVSLKVGRSVSSPDMRSTLGLKGATGGSSFKGSGSRIPAHRVGFSAHLEFYNDVDVPAISLFKYLMHLMLSLSPLWTARQGDIPRYTGSPDVFPRFAPPSKLDIPRVSPPALAHFILWLLLPLAYPLVALAIPMREDAGGGPASHLGLSLGVMAFWGLSKSFYAMLWFEAYFGTTLEYRYVTVAAAAVVAPMAHVGLCAAMGGLASFGVSLTGALVDVSVCTGVYFTLPRQEGRGTKGQLAISISLLLAFSMAMNLLKMLNTANARGPRMGYMLMLILPPIFTRLTTDVQEALPNTSLEFSVVSQGLLTYTFSLCTYNILVFFSLEIRLWKFYLVVLAADTACMFAVGPIWSLWSSAGYLRTSQYMQTIFGWAQNPIKPRPVLLKYYTRFMAALVFSVVLSVVRASRNRGAVDATGYVERGTELGDLWACALADASISATWIVFMYRLMKRRCSKDAFNDTVIQFSKNLADIQAGATVATLMVFLINSHGENGLLQ